MKENGGFEGVTPNAMHGAVRAQGEQKYGYNPVKISLRPALEKSLVSDKPVSVIAQESIPNFGTFNHFEQNGIVEFLLLSDMLKRGLWNEIATKIHGDFASDKLNTDPMTLGGKETTLKKFRSENFMDWQTTTECIKDLAHENGINAIIAWSDRMQTQEPDGMYKDRYVELDKNLQQKIIEAGITDPTKKQMFTPRGVIASGFATGISFPMGILKHIPALLKEKNIEPTKAKILEVFSQNMLSLSSKYASQDMMSFSAIESALNPRRNLNPVKSANFSPEYFFLDENNKIVFKKEKMENLAQKSTTEYGFISVGYQVALGTKFDEEDGAERAPGEASPIPWKQCPALVADVIMKYEEFVKPLAEKVLELQEEYK